MCTSYHHRSWPVKSFHGNLFPLNIPCFALSPLRNVACNISPLFFFVDKRGQRNSFWVLSILFIWASADNIRLAARVVGQRHELVWNALRSKYVTCSPNICFWSGFGYHSICSKYHTGGVGTKVSGRRESTVYVSSALTSLSVLGTYFYLCDYPCGWFAMCERTWCAAVLRIVFTPQDYLSVFAGEVVFYTVSSAITCSGYSVRAEWDSSKFSYFPTYISHTFSSFSCIYALLGANAHLLYWKDDLGISNRWFNLTPWTSCWEPRVPRTPLSVRVPFNLTATLIVWEQGISFRVRSSKS